VKPTLLSPKSAANPGATRRGKCHGFGWRVVAFAWLLSSAGLALLRAGETPFERGCAAYAQGEFEAAATAFAALANQAPAPGVFYNLGNAQWKCGRPGEAMLAWERAQWLAPFEAGSRNNLRFARQRTQLNAPELSWYEVASTWLPVNAWPWLATGSGWLAAAVLLLPAIFGWRRRDWHQAVAAGAIAVFLLTLPALVGVQSRTRLGVIRAKDTPLRLTPTRTAQTLVRLNAGEMARQVRTRGDYVFIRIGSDTAGWVRRGEFGRVSGR
jgi:hypothetical protein